MQKPHSYKKVTEVMGEGITRVTHIPLDENGNPMNIKPVTVAKFLPSDTLYDFRRDMEVREVPSERPDR